jgi:hypothetical protein
MKEFFEALFPLMDTDLGGNVEIRSLHEGTMPSQNWVRSPGTAERVAQELALNYDVYFGVLPRRDHTGSNEGIEDYTHVLWGDYDPKVLDKPGLFARITGLSPKPQIVVDSGSGYHVYWLLDRSYPFAEAQTVMRDIAAVTGGDNVHDKARILRLPGTLNHKHTPPKPVRLLRLDLLAPKHKLSDFYSYADKQDGGFIPTLSFDDLYGPRRAANVRSDVVPWWLAKLIAEDPGHGQRSEHVFHVVACLVENGWTDEEIEQVMIDNPQGVGAKYAEKGAAAHRWLHYPIMEARRRNSDNP